MMMRTILIIIFALTLLPVSPSIAQTADRISFDASNIDQLALLAAIADTDDNLDWLEAYWFDESGDYLVLVFEDYGGNAESRYGTLVVNMTTLEKQRLPMSDAIPVMVGDQLAIASEGQLVLWNIVTNTQVTSLGRFDGDLQQGPGCLMWYDGTYYQVADGLTGEIIGQVETTISPFTNFGFSSDCSRVAMLDVYDDVLLLWDSQSNSVIDVLSPTRYVFAPEYPLSFSANNRFFVWRSEGDRLSVYDFETESYIGLNRDSYSDFAARFIGNTLMTYEYNYREPILVEFWRNGETVFQETMLDITFRGDLMLMLTLENTLELWDGEEHIDTIEGVPFGGELVISPQANVVGVVDGQRYWLYDRRTGSSINTIAYDDFFVDDIAFSADESLYILPDGTNKRLRFHSMATGEQVAWVPGSYYWVSPDGSTLLLDYQYEGGVILYGIPEERTVQPALLGMTAANIISRRDQPTFNSPENGVAEGMLYIVGRSADNQFVYDANAEGWVRAGNAYVELFGRIEDLPVIESAPAWVSATLPERATLAFIAPETTPIEESETDFEVATDITDLPVITPDNAADVRLLAVVEGGPFAANGDYLATGNGSELTLWDLWTLEAVGSVDFG
ncbi:MAG: WD40 repeat domain-containing protein, partial [Chloroflexi bacterium]|nr:WD40 repeat domain-containing protein [Chloroflexota bacterium]